MKAGLVAALAGALVVSGCSGGSVEPQPGPGPSPTPSPSPTPTPTPTPPPTYATYDALAGDQQFQTACSGYILQPSPPVPLPATAFGNGFVIAYAATPQAYSVTGDGLTLSFGPGDVDPAAPAGVRAYAKATTGGTDRFSISRPAPGGTGLDYARAANVSGPRFGGLRQYFCVFGVPTLVTDIPPASTGPTIYTRTVIGASAYVREGSNARQFGTTRSTLTVSADFGARRITMTLVATGTPLAPAGADIPLGTFTGSGTIDPLTGNFSGTWTTDGRPGSGEFGGRFFGPQAREFGLALNIVAPDTGVQPGLTIAGTAFGSR